MVKKIIVAIIAFWSMAIYCSMPLFVHADSEIPDTVVMSADYVSAGSPYDRFGSTYFDDFGSPSQNAPYFISFRYFNKTSSNKFALVTATITFGNSEYFTFTQVGNGFTLDINSSYAISCQGAVYTVGNSSISRSSTINTNYTSNLPTQYTFNLSSATLNSNNTYQYYINFSRDTVLYDVETNLGEVTESCPLVFDFAPALSGTVERSYTNNGITYYSDTIIMGVTNTSGDNWAYNLCILDYYGNVVYQFLSYEWQRTFDISDQELRQAQFTWGRDQQTQLIGCDWHLVYGNTSEVQNFKWSQLPIKQDTTYTLEITAYKVSSGNSQDTLGRVYSYNVNDPLEPISPTSLVTAYTSTFTVSHLSDVVYDYTDDSNGIIPYQSQEDYIKARLTRLAVKDENNNIDYKNYSAYEDQNSWYNTGAVKANYDKVAQIIEDARAGNRSFTNNSLFSDGTGFSGAAVNFNSLSGVFNQWFGFVKTFFSYFPSAFWVIIYFGLVTLIVVGIVKKVL